MAMVNRHLSRSIVLQALFAIDKNTPKQKEQEREILEHCIREFAPGIENTDFIFQVFEGIKKKQSIIDEIIEKSAVRWSLEKIDTIDRNILRIGLFEMIFGDYTQVPPKVAINEAIEIAKTFGSQGSSKFINGVLGSVYQEMGEPMKHQISKSKQVVEKEEEIPVQQKAGAIVYSTDKDGILRLLMVHDVFGYWTLSKSSIKDTHNSLEEATIAALKKEVGLDITIIKPLEKKEYTAHHPDIGKMKKVGNFFLATSRYLPVSIQNKQGGLDSVKWFELEEILSLRVYPDIAELLATIVPELIDISKAKNETIEESDIAKEGLDFVEKLQTIHISPIQKILKQAKESSDREIQ
jgi:transcription antitermination protein NusB